MEDRRVDLRRRAERARRDAERQTHVTVKLGKDGQAAIGLTAGRGGDALSDLELEHERHLVNRGARLDQRHQDRLADAVRQVADDQDAPALGAASAA